MHPVSCPNSHHDVTDLENHGMVNRPYSRKKMHPYIGCMGRKNFFKKIENSRNCLKLSKTSLLGGAHT